MKTISVLAICLALLPRAALGADTVAVVSADPVPGATGHAVHRRAGDLAWLASRASLIFVGYLAHKTVARDSRGLIVSYNHFDVERVISGEAPREVTLTTLGGTLEGETLSVSHMPVFEPNRRYVIFADPGRGTYDPVVGNEAGVFLVGADSGIYTHGGKAVVAVHCGRLRLGSGQLEPGTCIPASPQENPRLEGSVLAVTRQSPSLASPLSVDAFLAAVIALKETPQ